MAIGRLSPSTPVYQTSGESTPSQKLPEKFAATPMPNSPLTTANPPVTEWYNDIKRAPIVSRVPRRGGMRYLYARGAVTQPINRLGNSVRPAPNISAFNTEEMGPIHDAGFNDRLYQAGYPGFNLGLSFKVQNIQTTNQPSSIMQSTQRLRGKAVKVKRPSGRMQ